MVCGGDDMDRRGQHVTGWPDEMLHRGHQVLWGTHEVSRQLHEMVRRDGDVAWTLSDLVVK